MLDADAVINNSSQKVGGSNAYPDPAPKKRVGPDQEKRIGSMPLVTAGSAVPQPATESPDTRTGRYVAVRGIRLGLVPTVFQLLNNALITGFR